MNDYYKACDLNLKNKRDKIEKEYFNEYGYNISSHEKTKKSNFEKFICHKQNDLKEKR